MALPGNKNFSDYDNYITDSNPTTSAQAQDYFRNQAELLKAVIDCDFWQPETVYQPGDVVKSDSMPNGTEAVMVATKASVTSNVEPQWGAVGSANISDGACFWKLRWQHWSKEVEQITDLTTGTTNRLPNTNYAVGNVVYDRSNLSVALKCITAGATSNTELDISSKVVGESVEDGSVVWGVVKRDLSAEVSANASAISERNIKTYTSLTELGLPITATLIDIYNALPDKSSLMFEMESSTHTGLGFAEIAGVGGTLVVFKNELRIFADYYLYNYAHWVKSYVAGGGESKWVKMARNDSLSMPSWNKIELAVPSVQNNHEGWLTLTNVYTAPADGWIYLQGDGYESWYSSCVVYISEASGVRGSSTGVYIKNCIPVAKGQNISIDYRKIQRLTLFWFYYAQSEV